MNSVSVDIYQPKSGYGWWVSVSYMRRYRLQWARTRAEADGVAEIASQVIVDDSRNVDLGTVAEVMAPLRQVSRKAFGAGPCVTCKTGTPASMSGECLRCHRLSNEDR